MNHLTRDGIGVRCVSCNRPLVYEFCGYSPEPVSIPLRNCNLLPIPIPELNWNCHNWNLSWNFHQASTISTGPLAFWNRRASSGQWHGIITGPYGPVTFCSDHKLSYITGPIDNPPRWFSPAVTLSRSMCWKRIASDWRTAASYLVTSVISSRWQCIQPADPIYIDQ